jgi:hypothetical protein
MQEERMQILKMLEAGTITADDAARLLDALGDHPPSRTEAAGGKRLRIRVTNRDTGKHAVNLTIPIGLAKIAAKFVPARAKQKLAEEGVDVDAVLSSVLSENIGKLVDIDSESDHVEISIE